MFVVIIYCLVQSYMVMEPWEIFVSLERNESDQQICFFLNHWEICQLLQWMQYGTHEL